jgi:hypothetical protein
VLLIVVGIQLLSLGLLGQMLVQIRRERQGPETLDAQIERTVGLEGRPGPRADDSSRAATGTTVPG